MRAQVDHGAERGRRTEHRHVAVDDVVGCVDRGLGIATGQQQQQGHSGEEGVHAQFPEYA
jgi:hypothetical protein